MRNLTKQDILVAWKGDKVEMKRFVSPSRRQDSPKIEQAGQRKKKFVQSLQGELVAIAIAIA